MFVSTNFIGFLLSLFLIIAIGAFIGMFIKRKVIPFPKKFTYWLLLVYFIVLLLSAVIVSFIGDKSFEMTDYVSIQNNNEDEAEEELYDALHQGNLDKIDPHFLTYKDRYKYERSSLDIDLNIEENQYISVYVERKETNDNEIEAYIFGNTLLVDGYSFSEKIVPPKISLKDDTLSIEPLEHQEVDIWIGKKEFTVNQFKNVARESQSYTNYIDPNIYLRIPKDLQIHTRGMDKEDINFVNKSR